MLDNFFKSVNKYIQFICKKEMRIIWARHDCIFSIPVSDFLKHGSYTVHDIQLSVISIVVDFDKYLSTLCCTCTKSSELLLKVLYKKF